MMSQGSIASLVCLIALSMGAGIAGTARPPLGDVEAIIKWEHAAAAADLAGDAEFYAKNLSDQWTDGMSDGTFQNKEMLLKDLRDSKGNSTISETLGEIKVNVFDDVAVATYRETYDALIHEIRVRKTIITTDTFLKQSGRWIQIAAHSSDATAPKKASIP